MDRSRRARLALLAVLAVVAAACASGDDGQAAPAGDAAATDDEAAAPVGIVDRGDPVPVDLVPEAAGSTETLGPPGGVVQATAADGTGYRLLVPPGALPRPTAITMTPLADVAGLPGDAALRFGVALEPEGLVFAAPSWLYVDSDVDPEAVDGGFGVSGGDATLRGVAHDGERFVLTIGHFSGAGGFGCAPRCGGAPGGGWPGLPGGGSGGPPPPGGSGGGSIGPPGGGVPPWDPGTPPGPFPDGGDGSSGGGRPDPGSLVPEGDGRSGDAAGPGDLDTDAGEAIQDLADAQLTGDEAAEAAAEEALDEIKARVKDAAWDAAERACVEERDVTELGELLHWLVLGQLLGAAADDAEDETLTSLIGVCFRFEMDAVADLTMKLGGETFVFGDSIEQLVPLAFNGLGLEGRSEGTVDPTGYDRGAEILEVMGMGLAAFAGVEVPNDLAANDYFSCTTTPGTGALDVVATDLFTADGPVVSVAPSVTSDAVVSCQEPFTNMPITPFVVDLTYYPETGFPGVTDGGILFGDWTVTGEGSPFATTSVHHVVSEEGAELFMAWDLVLRHAPGELPPRPER